MPPILVDIENGSTSAKYGPGPISALNWRWTRRLDRAGQIAFDTPAVDSRASILSLRRYARCYSQIGGFRTEIGLGIIDTIANDTDRRVLSVGGDDLLRELALRSVSFLELKEAGETPMTLEDALDAILASCNAQADPDWTLDRTTYATTGDTTSGNSLLTNVTNITDWVGREGTLIYGDYIPAGTFVATVNTATNVIAMSDYATTTATGVSLSRWRVFYEFAGESVLAAFAKVAQLTGTHFRLGTGREIVWVFNTRAASGIRAVIGVDPVAAVDNPNICLITSLEYIQDSSDVISRVYPHGSGTGSSRMDLSGTTRTAPDGYVLNAASNYIERTAAATDYGFATRHQTFSDIGPTVPDTDPNYFPALENGQNTLFDAAAEYLRRHSYPLETYRMQVTKLDQLILPGETIRVIYKAWVPIDGSTDKYQWVDVDEDLLVLEATAELTDTGIHTPGLVVATVDRWPSSDVELLVKLAKDVQSGQTHDQPVAYAQSSGSSSGMTGVSIASGTTISGGGTIALGGYTATIPATGTVAMVGTSITLLDADVTATTISNDATEQTLYSFSVPGGTLGTANKLRLVMIGAFLNNTGGNAVPTVKVKYGATTILSDVPAALATSAQAHGWRVESELVANNATNAQIAIGTTYIGSTAGLSGVSNGTTLVRTAVHASVAEDSTAAKNLVVTVTLPSAAATLTFTCYNVFLEVLRR